MFENRLLEGVVMVATNEQSGFLTILGLLFSPAVWSMKPANHQVTLVTVKYEMALL